MPRRGNVTPQTGPCARAAERWLLFLNFPHNRISAFACSAHSSAGPAENPVGQGSKVFKECFPEEQEHVGSTLGLLPLPAPGARPPALRP